MPSNSSKILPVYLNDLIFLRDVLPRVGSLATYFFSFMRSGRVLAWRSKIRRIDDRTKWRVAVG